MTKVVNLKYPKIILKIPSLDSFQVAIPIALIGRENLHPNITEIQDTFARYSGEFIKESYLGLALEMKGYTIRAYIQKRQSNGIFSEYLIILINSKFLEKQYFEGITKQNFPIVFDRLLQVGVFNDSLKYQDFISYSIVTDWDIKQDFQISEQDWFRIRTQTKQLKHPEHISCNSMFKGNGRGNLGFHFNKREQSTHTFPFVKGYSKEAELNSNEKKILFRDSFLKGVDLKDLRRIEMQVKDKKHAELLGLKDHSLKTILALSQNELQKIQNKLFAKYSPTSFKNQVADARLNLKDWTKIDYKEFYILNDILKRVAENESCFTTEAENVLNEVPHQNRKAKLKFKKMLEKFDSHLREKGFNLMHNNFNHSDKMFFFNHFEMNLI